MLVFKRNRGERIVIGGEVIVEVVEVGPGWVRLGTTAAPDITVDREEVHLQKQARQTPPNRTN